MSDNDTPHIRKCEWRVPDLTLRMEEVKGCFQLSPQTRRGNLLSALADLYYPQVALCALDVLFLYGYSCRDREDALIAYSALPLKRPPEEYRQLCWGVNWEHPVYGENLRSIILAGSDEEVDIELMLKILKLSSHDTRDGVLYAASAMNDVRVIEEVARLATNGEVGHGTGEIYAIGLCFQRWIERRVLSVHQLESILRKADIHGSMLGFKHWMNFLFCANWEDIPYPSVLLHRAEGIRRGFIQADA